MWLDEFAFDGDDEVAAGPGVEVELRALEVADDGVALVAADAEGVGGEFVAAVAERKHLAGEELHRQHFRFGGGQRRLLGGLALSGLAALLG